MLKFAANYCRFWVIDYYNISPLPHSTLVSRENCTLFASLCLVTSFYVYQANWTLTRDRSFLSHYPSPAGVIIPVFWFLHVVNIWLARLNIWYKHRQFVPRWHVGGQFSDCNSSTPLRGTKRGEDTSSRIFCLLFLVLCLEFCCGFLFYWEWWSAYK